VKRPEGMAQTVESLPSKCKALSSNPAPPPIIIIITRREIGWRDQPRD
jgi:hypothetical protein